MKVLFAVICTAVACVFVGCASGPSFSTYRDSLPQLDAQKARIYFYRTAVMGAAIQPAVHLNGNEVGKAQPKGVFFEDVMPGDYEIVTATEVTRKLSLKIEKGQTRYVRLNISMGFMVGHVYPELVDESVGAKEILDCHFVGKTK